jgi:hypothetical protein
MRERGILGREVLRVLVFNSVQWFGCPITLADHVRAIDVILCGSRLSYMLRLYEGNEVVLEKILQRGRGLLLTDAH